MAFATVVSRTPSENEANDTTPDIALPATVDAGDLLIAIVCTDQNPTFTWPGAWPNELFAMNNGNLVRVEARWKIADGTEDGGTIAITLSTGEQWEAVVYRITGHHATVPPEATTATGASTTPDPPTLNPTGWGTEDTLWIEGWGNDHGSRTFSGTYSTGFTNGQFAASAGTGGCGLGNAYKNDAVASIDPAANSALSTSDDWIAFTIAVPPAGGAAAIVKVSWYQN